MDEQQQQRINQASEQLTDSAVQSFQMLADRTVSLQESNLQLTQKFLQNWIEQVHNRAEGTRQATQNLQEQSQQQREAVETLSQEGANAYSEFLNSALSFYQETLSTAMRVGQRSVQNAAQATQQGVQAASQVGQQAAQHGAQVGQQGAEAANQTTGVPIEDYDSLNVNEIVEQLDSLSAEELQAARAYEQQNKDRDSLIAQIDRRINAAS